MYLAEQQIWNAMQILAEYLEEEQTSVQSFENCLRVQLEST